MIIYNLSRVQTGSKTIILCGRKRGGGRRRGRGGGRLKECLKKKCEHTVFLKLLNLTHLTRIRLTIFQHTDRLKKNSNIEIIAFLESLGPKTHSVPTPGQSHSRRQTNTHYFHILRETHIGLQTSNSRHHFQNGDQSKYQAASPSRCVSLHLNEIHFRGTNHSEGRIFATLQSFSIHVKPSAAGTRTKPHTKRVWCMHSTQHSTAQNDV